MSKKSILVIADFMMEKLSELNLEEFCRACEATPEFVQEALEYGVIEVIATDLEQLRFNADHLRRMRVAVRLHRDLEINMAGIAIVLNLMDEVERLRSHVQLFERHFY